MKKLLIILLIIAGVVSAYAITPFSTDDPTALVAKKTAISPANKAQSDESVKLATDNNRPGTPLLSSVDCPAGANSEAEVCGDDTNGGCLMAPGTEQFEAISCGDAVCGTYWSDDVDRDLDWYELNLTERGFIKWTAVGEAPTRIWMYDGSAGCADPVYLASTAADPEDTAMVEIELTAGTYWLVVGPDDWYDMPCDGSGDYPNDYVVMVECELGTPVIDVTPDSIYGEALEGYSTTENLTIANTGAGRLKFTVAATQDFIMTLSNSENERDIDFDQLDIETLISREYSDAYREFIESNNLSMENRQSENPLISAVDCPPDGVAEAEACGDNTNGGCAMSPGTEAWETISCNSSVCGTVWSDGTNRDTDWYLMSLTESTLLNWSVTADFPLMTILLLPGELGNGCGDYEALFIDLADPGDTAKVIANLPAGDYWLWVGPTAWYDMPCDGSGDYPNDYVGSLTCDPPWLNIDIAGGTIHQGDAPVEISILLDAADLVPGTYTGALQVNSNDDSNNPVDIPIVFVVNKVFGYMPGDANMAAGIWPATVDNTDITYMVEYFRKHNDGCEFEGFFASADANGDCRVNVTDVTYLVRYLAGLGGTPLHCPAFPAMPPVQETYPECQIIEY